MKYTPLTLCVSRLRTAALGILVASAAMTGTAQTPVNAASEATVRAEQQHNRDIAACNGGNLPAPQRDTCIREAGLRLDYQRGLPAATETGQTTDGRATVMTPSAASTVLRGSTTTTSDDGRATVVVPEAAPR